MFEFLWFKQSDEFEYESIVLYHEQYKFCSECNYGSAVFESLSSEKTV